MEGYSVEWVGVIVAVVAQMALGFTWYAPPVFGNRWMAGLGRTKEDMATRDPTPFVVVVIGAFVTAVFVSALLDWSQSGSAGDGLVVGVYLGIVSGLAVAAGHLFEQRPWSLTLINSTSELARMTLVGLVLGFWQ